MTQKNLKLVKKVVAVVTKLCNKVFEVLLAVTTPT
jgi:hypothetical protein